MSNIQLPDWSKSLINLDIRNKVMLGGRGGAKSWTVARVLLLLGAQDHHRFLCGREIQKSIRDSVHRLLRDQIDLMGLGDFYEVLDNEIRGKNGTLFLFTGLRSHTASTIKSFEGITVCWIEEAHSVSKESWDILIPTIRAEGSEIWLTMNPDLDTDESYKRFVTFAGDDTWIKEVNHRDNPWFPEVLELERQKAQRTMLKEDYDNIWEGKPRSTVPGAIYRHEVQEVVAEGRLRLVPYDPLLPVHTVWDLGWNDAMSIIMVQKDPMSIRIINYLEDSHRTLSWYIAELDKTGYRWGTDYLPHDGGNGNFHTGKSTEKTLKGMKRKVKVLPRLGIQEGIRMARMMSPRVYIDKDKGGQLFEHLKRYRRDISSKTDEAVMPVHDAASHGADAYRYLAMAVDQMINEEPQTPIVQPWTPLDREFGT